MAAKEMAEHLKKAVPKKEPKSILESIGNTPLVEVSSLSSATGCRIMIKCEHLNPFGSVKDRAALRMIEDAERKGQLKPGDTIVEASGGNTSISMAMIAALKGYKTLMV